MDLTLQETIGMHFRGHVILASKFLNASTGTSEHRARMVHTARNYLEDETVDLERTARVNCDANCVENRWVPK